MNRSSLLSVSRHYLATRSAGIVAAMDITPVRNVSRPGTDPGHPPVATPRPQTHGDHPVDRPVVLSVRALRCRYGTFEAVRGIDLTVRRGELFALLGTNGAGKTTTLETLEGHRRAHDGHVEVLGVDPFAERRRLAARIGLVFQSSGLPAGLTPREVLGLWPRLTPSAARHLAVDDVLARIELDHRADVRIGALSGGERRRLDLGLALINDPELIFLDEPTAAMDPEARLRTWRILRELLADGVTVVLTTHELEEAEALADRIAIMHDGLLAATGTLAELVATHPAVIAARLPHGAPPLPDLGGHVEHDVDRRLRIETRHLQRDLTALLLWSRDHGVRLDDLQATEASLAQVFHAIAGHGPSTDGQEAPR